MTPDAKTPEQIAMELMEDSAFDFFRPNKRALDLIAAAIRAEREAKVQDAVTSSKSLQQVLEDLPSDIDISREYGRKGVVREWIKQQLLVGQPRSAHTTSDEELEQLAKSKCVFSNSGKRGFRIGFRAAEAKQVWPTKEDEYWAWLEHNRYEDDECTRDDYNNGVRGEAWRAAIAWLKVRIGGKS